MGLMEDLGEGPVGLDTAIFIYFIEEHPRYLPILDPLFRALDDGRLSAVTSGITLMETLVVPYRSENDALASRYEDLLRRSEGVRMSTIDVPLLRFAAFLRASTGNRTPDTLQLAAAMSAGCRVLLTNDRRFRAPAGIKILQLKDYLEPREAMR